MTLEHERVGKATPCPMPTTYHKGPHPDHVAKQRPTCYKQLPVSHPLGLGVMHIHSKVHYRGMGTEDTHVGPRARLWANWEEVQRSRYSWSGLDRRAWGTRHR